MIFSLLFVAFQGTAGTGRRVGFKSLNVNVFLSALMLSLLLFPPPLLFISVAQISSLWKLLLKAT